MLRFLQRGNEILRKINGKRQKENPSTSVEL